MIESLLHLSFEKWGVFLVSAIPACINIGIYIYVSFYLAFGTTNRFFAAFVFLLALSQLTNGLMQMSPNAESGLLWFRLSLSSFVLALPFGLLFVIRFTCLHKIFHYSLLMILVLIPAIFIEFIIIDGLDKYTMVRSKYWFWVAPPEHTMVNFIIYCWISIISFSTLAVLWFHYIKEKVDFKKKNQLLLLSLGYTVPFIIGMTTQVIFPLVLNKEPIPLNTPAITAFSIATLIALKKYQLLDFSPKHQMDKIIEQMNEGILIVDNSDKIMYANETFCQLVEYNFEEIKGKTATELFIEDPEQKKIITNALEKRKNKISCQYEIQMSTKSGKKIWMLTKGASYLDRKGNIIGSIALLTDISYLKESEEKLKASNKELETYIYKASHDFRAPIASMLGLMQLSEREIKDETALLYFGMFETMTQKLDTMLSDLIKSMAIKDTETFNDEINFQELIDETLTKFEHIIEYSSIKIYTNIPISSSFFSSKFILNTIFQNVIGNSIKYQNVNQQESFLKINITNHEKKIIITFEDNGIGIEKSQQSKIFDMYYRANELSKGSGLGLYLIKKGIEKLNGEIKVDSELGKGTTFTIIL